MKEFKISIADLVFLFNFKKASKPFLEIIRQRYENFLTDKIEKLKVDVYFIKNLPSISNVGVYNNIIIGEGFVFFNNELFIRENNYCFENFLRIFYSYHLSLNGGILIHSAGIFKKDFSFVFVGKSGVGKTTLSYMLSKHSFKVMSDEVCAIRFINDSFYLYSTPFWGSFKKPKTINLSKKLNFIFFPFKSKKFFVTDMSKKDTIKKMLGCVFNFSNDKEISLSIFNFVVNLINHVSYKALYFSLDSKKIVFYINSLLYKKYD